MGSNGRNVMVPGQVEIGCDYKYNPVMSTPAQMITQGPGGATMHVFGGYTKLEDIATRLACAMIEQGSVVVNVPEKAVEMAKEILERSVAIDSQRGAPREPEPANQG